jgi:hypothetical protein
MIVPYGKSKDSEELKKYSLFNQFEEPEAEESLDDSGDALETGSDEGAITEDVGKAEEVERYLNETLGGPTLDNLMIVLTAIGMSKISLSLSEDKSSLSVSGVIGLADDNKIKKEN